MNGTLLWEAFSIIFVVAVVTLITIYYQKRMR